MSAVQRLGHVAIRVNDMDRAVGFYTDLGMRMVWKADDWCYLEAGDSRDGLALLGAELQSCRAAFRLSLPRPG